MDRSQEQRLLRRAAGGDRSAAEACIRAHQDSVYAYVLRLSGDAHLAEDVTQEAFVRVLTNLERFDPRYRFSTWVFTIARRIYINARQKRSPVADGRLVSERPDRREQEAWAAPVDDATASLVRALGWLSDHQREAVILFHCHGWTVGEIASHMKIPAGTVKSHLHRGRRELRRLLTREPSRERNLEQEMPR